MRRFVFVLVGAVSSIALFASAASGRCIVERFEKVLADSDAAWWVTVTDAALSGEQEPGYWRLSVRVEHALKGPPDGTSATVYSWSCGPFMPDRMRRKTAASFVGSKRLFMGDLRDDGTMVAFSEVLTPQGLSPGEQYQRALDNLSLAAPSSSEPEELSPAGRDSGGGSGNVWVAVAVVVLGAFVLFLGRRRSPTS